MFSSSFLTSISHSPRGFNYALPSPLISTSRPLSLNAHKHTHMLSCSDTALGSPRCGTTLPFHHSVIRSLLPLSWLMGRLMFHFHPAKWGKLPSAITPKNMAPSLHTFSHYFTGFQLGSVADDLPILLVSNGARTLVSWAEVGCDTLHVTPTAPCKVHSPVQVNWHWQSAPDTTLEVL